MKYRLMAFMAGRNGFDALSNTLIWASILAMFASRLIPNQVAHMLRMRYPFWYLFMDIFV